MDATTCAICLDDFDASTEEQDLRPYTLECRHSFHTKCVMDWFRQGNTCPMCKAEPNHTGMNRLERIRTLRQISDLCRRKDCPANVKNKMNRLRTHRASMRERARQTRSWRKENKNILCRDRQLRMQHWKDRRKDRLLSADLFASVQLQPIFIVKK